MNYSRTYGGLIWTNHAMQRLEERYLSQDIAWQAYKYPDSSYRGKQDGTIEYIKKYQNSTITLIVKPNERRELLVLSAWIDPPLPGTQDAKKRDQYQEYRKATGWKKIWLIIKQQLGF